MENPKVKLISQLEELLAALKGKKIRIGELICRNMATNYDRHSTTYSRLTFTVTTVGWYFSGGHFHIDGEDSVYSISTANLQSVSQTEHGIEIEEKFESQTLRKSIISVLSHAPNNSFKADAFGAALTPTLGISAAPCPLRL